MEVWPEVEKAKAENRHELVLTGKLIASRIEKKGLDRSIFNLINLNYLNLSETGISEIHDNIANLKNLQTLMLYSNNFEHINDNISKLGKLKVLDLSRNSLKSIPDSFAKLPLVTLNLNVNQLETFPPFTENHNLTVLDLSNNKLKAFPEVCSDGLINLSEIKLRGNEIEEIPNKINSLSSLKFFDIGDNKLKSIPGELSDCQKLKDLNLKGNPITDRRLSKLIDQCRTKQVLDYIKQHCIKTNPKDTTKSKGKNRKKTKSTDSDDEDDVPAEYKYCITIKNHNEAFKVIVMNAVKNVREHFIACIVNDVCFTEETFKKFIQLQNKLHDTVCEKRNTATIATHDFNKLPPGNIIYTTLPPNSLIITPLNRSTEMTGADLLTKLQTEANNLRKEKKRSTYSGIHKFLYLIEGKPQYPCVLNSKNEVISFPPLTNSNISKIETNTTNIFIEVTSTISQQICKNIVSTILKEMLVLFEKDLVVQQVKIVDQMEQMKILYPCKTDLVYDKTASIQVKKE
ncbi:unnamed protein product [Phyllotreta striolata]|uniref:B3/B4 tRNA-binding domain-containing protein n=1 Tax=Phyllotreta striolata TaxID=444603 RepID=A0A9N9TV25_PHYSR|nr:unnamed protein product [Phyllotreta striolata]